MVVGSNRGVEVRDQLVAFTNNETREAPSNLVMNYTLQASQMALDLATQSNPMA